MDTKNEIMSCFQKLAEFEDSLKRYEKNKQTFSVEIFNYFEKWRRSIYELIEFIHPTEEKGNGETNRTIKMTRQIRERVLSLLDLKDSLLSFPLYEKEHETKLDDLLEEVYVSADDETVGDLLDYLLLLAELAENKQDTLSPSLPSLIEDNNENEKEAVFRDTVEKFFYDTFASRRVI